MPFENFHHYIKDTTTKLKQHHAEIDPELLELMAPKQFIAKNNSKNNKKGILLIHGLLDTCTSMHSLYDSFCAEGYNVNSILLPGHGTSPEELLNIKYQQWIQCAELALYDLNTYCDDVTIIGLSAGAIIASFLAQIYSEKVSRLILFAPAFKLLPKATAVIPSLHRLNELAPIIAKHWLSFKDENDKTKYKSITTNCIFQLMTLIDKVQLKNKNSIKCPIFMIISKDDETVSYQSAIDFFNRQNHKKNQLLIYNNNKKLNNVPIQTEVVDSCIPKENILNYSHVCMHVSPNHLTYGKKQEDTFLYLGALNKQNQLNYNNKLKRLTYNPHYNVLIKKLYDFINKTEHNNHKQ